MRILNFKINPNYDIIGKAFIKISKVLACLLVVIGIAATSQETKAVTYEPQPDNPERRGFYYWFNMADYSNLLLSSMPYRVMQTYIVADSFMKVAPSWRVVDERVHQMDLFSDTINHICKHWFLANEYDPIRFYAFLTKRYSNPANDLWRLKSTLASKISPTKKLPYIWTSHILHIYVNQTVLIDTMNTEDVNLPLSKIVAHCKILDTIKGKVFPSLDSAIFYNGELSNSGSGVVSNIYITPQQTDIVFSYAEHWLYMEDDQCIMWIAVDSNGNELPREHWINPYKEYIVFLDIFGDGGILNDDGTCCKKTFYTLSPYPTRSSNNIRRSYGMFPIEDGYVLDRGNDLGFGTSIPVEVFKQNIRTKITDIKEYGE